jgi:predicted RNase H-like HicB family nuclease
MKIDVKPDGDGYLAKVRGRKNLFAFGYSVDEALRELENVVNMMMDYHLELVETERKVRNKLQKELHAV